MVVKKLTFLKPVGRDTSVRDWELNRSDAKSHASKFVHQRLRAIAKRSQSSRSSTATPEVEEEVRHRNFLHADPTPLTVVRHGNSDPFAASTVAITPRINEAINFFKTYYVPTAEPRFFRTSSEAIANEFIVPALQHETSARAFVSHMITLMASVSPDDKFLQQGQLRVRNKAISSLRLNMHLASSDSDVVPTAMKFMFMEAAFSGNIAEAKMHGSMLAKLLYGKWRTAPSALDLAVLIHVIYVDGQLAVRHLRKTIFDLNWVEEVLAPSLQLVDQWLAPHLPSIVDPLDTAIGDPILRRWLIEYRKAAFCLTFDLSALPQGQGQLLMFFVSLRAATVSGHLANHYQRLQRVLDHKLTIEERYEQLTYSALVLALFEYGNKPESMRVYKRFSLTGNDGDLVLHELQRTLSQIQLIAPTLSSELATRYVNCHFWCLFAGAQAEQHASSQSPKVNDVQSDPYAAYLNRSFARLACRTEKFTWPAIRSVLEKILHSDTFLPHGKAWAEGAISEYLRSGSG